MTYEELQEKIADIDSHVEDRYQAAMKSWSDYWYNCVKQKKVVIKPKPHRSQFEHHAQIAVDRLRKEFAMQTSPADIGDVIESEKRVVDRNGRVKEIRYLMRVERIEVSSFGKPILAFYGTYLKRDMTPMIQQIFRPILQPDITRVVKSHI